MEPEKVLDIFSLTKKQESLLVLLNIKPLGNGNFRQIQLDKYGKVVVIPTVSAIYTNGSVATYRQKDLEQII